MEAEEKSPEAEGGAPQGDDPLDPDLVDIFRDAKNEVLEGTLASELEAIPIQDLLSDLKGVSDRLGVEPRAHAEPTALEASEPSAKPTTTEASEPIADAGERGEPPAPDHPEGTQSAAQSLSGYRRYMRHGLFFALIVATAIGGGLGGAGQLAAGEPAQEPPHEPLAIISTGPGVVVRQDNQTGGAAPPTLETASEAIPEPPQPDRPEGTQWAAQSPTGYRGYTQGGLFVALIVVTAIGVGLGLWCARRLAAGEPAQEPSQKPPAAMSTGPGAVVRQDNQTEGAAPPTPEAASETIPEPPRAYSSYIVQPGDTVSSIAHAFGMSTDYVLWSNPDVIDDPRLRY